jgi:hypothetical protein
MSPSFGDYTNEEEWCPDFSASACGNTPRGAGFSELT